MNEYNVPSDAKPLLIACGILRRELTELKKRGGLDADLYFLPEELHNDLRRLETTLRTAIEEHSSHRPGRVVVVYGDLCLGLDGGMRRLVEEYGAVKPDALNCIDCLLGGRGAFRKVDPDRAYYFLNPAFLMFSDRFRTVPTRELRERFRSVKGIVLLDALGTLDAYREDIATFSERTGLPVVARLDVGLDGLESIVLEAIRALKNRNPSPDPHPAP